MSELLFLLSGWAQLGLAAGHTPTDCVSAFQLSPGIPEHSALGLLSFATLLQGGMILPEQWTCPSALVDMNNGCTDSHQRHLGVTSARHIPVTNCLCQKQTEKYIHMKKCPHSLIAQDHSKLVAWNDHPWMFLLLLHRKACCVCGPDFFLRICNFVPCRKISHISLALLH